MNNFSKYLWFHEFEMELTISQVQKPLYLHQSKEYKKGNKWGNNPLYLQKLNTSICNSPPDTEAVLQANVPIAESRSPILFFMICTTSVAEADEWNSIAWYWPSIKWNLA